MFIDREEFDSIIKHYIEPIIGRIRLDPENPKHLESLTMAYDNIFEDMKEASKYIGEKKDYPRKMMINYVRYDVRVNRDSDDEIQWFGIYNEGTNDLVCENDWSGPLDFLYVLNFLKESLNENEESVSQNHTEDHSNDSKGAESEEDQNSVNDETVEKIEEFDFLYSDYKNYPDEFKIQAIDDLKGFSNESHKFRNILVSEWTENWDEFGEF